VKDIATNMLTAK